MSIPFIAVLWDRFMNKFLTPIRDTIHKKAELLGGPMEIIFLEQCRCRFAIPRINAPL